MSRWIVLMLAVVLGGAGCSLVEQEQRPAQGMARRSMGATPPPITNIAASRNSELWPLDAPSIHAKSAVLIDAETGETLYQKNADEHRQVASTQKILTALLVTERGGLDEMITVQASDANVEPTNAGIRAGQQYSRRQLLSAMLVHSCNDAAAALGRDYAGSVTEFAAVMNARAVSLGAYSSHFVNPNGLPAAQYSTARDMARIAYRVWRNPTIRGIMCQSSYPFVFSNGRVKTLKSTNLLLGRFPGVDGMKTGYTDAAGRCLITSATIGGHSYILVQLGSRTSYIFDDAAGMLQWAASRRAGSIFAAN